MSNKPCFTFFHFRAALGESERKILGVSVSCRFQRKSAACLKRAGVRCGASLGGAYMGRGVCHACDYYILGVATWRIARRPRPLRTTSFDSGHKTAALHIVKPPMPLTATAFTLSSSILP
jgi:hypothetical protein